MTAACNSFDFQQEGTRLLGSIRPRVAPLLNHLNVFLFIAFCDLRLPIHQLGVELKSSVSPQGECSLSSHRVPFMGVDCCERIGSHAG